MSTIILVTTMAYLEQAIDIVAQRTIPASALNVMPTRTLTV